MFAGNNICITFADVNNKQNKSGGNSNSAFDK